MNKNKDKPQTYQFMQELLKLSFKFIRLLGSLCLESNHGIKKTINQISFYTNTN